MPRTARTIEAGLVYHVFNRGNGKSKLFHTPAEFEAFQQVLAQGLELYPVDLLAWCLMDNHWHLVLRPREDDALGRFMGWVGVTHVRRHYSHHRSAGGGHLYQGRYKSFPVQENGHFLALCRYIEANPLRAKRVRRAEKWRWSSLHWRGNVKNAVSKRKNGRVGERAGDEESEFVLKAKRWPVDRPRNWVALVNAPTAAEEAARIRLSLKRGRPLGDAAWVKSTAARLDLEWTLRPRGRPRKDVKE